jgi:hypothetical protein
MNDAINFALQYCFRSIRLPSGNRKSERCPKADEGWPMTDAGQALLFAGEFLCLLFSVIAMLYFADRVRSELLQILNELAKRHHFRGQR